MKKTLTYLIAAVALMLINAGAMAQGGGSPMAGSTHGYKVNPGDIGNDFLWEITGGTAGTDYTVNSTDMVGDSINITWLAPSVGTSFVLRFTETDKTTLTCSSAKELLIDPITNSFDVGLLLTGATCNAEDGNVNPADSVETTFVVDVYMLTGGTSWNPDWEVTVTLNPSQGRVMSLAVQSGSTGDLTQTGVGEFIITNIPSNPSDPGKGELTLDAIVKGATFEDLSCNVTITGKDLDYNTPATGSEVKIGNKIINGLPDTGDIQTN